MTDRNYKIHGMTGRAENPSVLEHAKRHYGKLRETARSAFSTARAPEKGECLVFDNGGKTEYPQYSVVCLSPRSIRGEMMYQAVFLDIKPTLRISPYGHATDRGRTKALSRGGLIPKNDFIRLKRSGFAEFGEQIEVSQAAPKARAQIRDFIEDMEAVFSGKD